MRLVVISHKVCWRKADSASGFATDGGFPFQMRAISELFDETRLVLPLAPRPRPEGEIPLSGKNLSVVPLGMPTGADLARKAAFPGWLLKNLPKLWREIRRANAVHAPIPGDIGTIGLLLALAARKPLFVRHCGNWFARDTAAQHFWGWLLERYAGGRTVVFATGGGEVAPSRNKNVHWIFATSLTEAELAEYAVARAGPASESPRLIIVCRQERGKGTDAVIQSLPLLADRFPGISLDVVGDGAALADFRRVANECRVTERVRFHGKVDHRAVMQLLKQADLFCYPTASEGFSKGVLEALASGLPVVSTRVSVLGQLVGGGAGILIERATAQEVARGVRSCLDDPERYRRMSETAVRTARQYSLERWRDSIGESLSAAWGPVMSSNA